MSSNDYILIKEGKISFTISHRDADTGKRLQTIGHAVYLDDAVRMANNSGIFPEYNLVIKLLEVI